MVQPMPEAELEAAWEWSNRYGPSNCWAGSAAEGAIHIRNLLVEVARLQRTDASVQKPY